MKTTLLRFWKSSFLAVFALFGINDTIVAQYGCIEFSYRVQGIVVDKDSKAPIPNIAVNNIGNENRNQTVATDSNGYFEFHQSRVPSEIILEAKDIDGKENGGKYLPEKYDLKASDKDFETEEYSNSRWYWEIGYKDTIYIEMQKEKIFDPKTERINTEEKMLKTVQNREDSIAETQGIAIDSTIYHPGKEKFIVYPNPTKGMLQLYYFSEKKSIQKLQIYSVDGKLMLEENITEQTFEIKRSFSVTHWAKGVYLLLLLTEEDIITKQFIKN
jgi:putative lipoprotein (rSAM/lipoprotein system)